MGVFARTLKSNALCVYFQMYSQLKTRIFSEKPVAGRHGIVAKAGCSAPCTLQCRRQGDNTSFAQPC